MGRMIAGYALTKEGKFMYREGEWTRLDAMAKKPNDQAAKADAKKLRLTLVPRKILSAIAKVREYGNKKYSDPDNWKTVSAERYRDAAFRHFVKYLDEPNGVDAESGLPHLWHLACNIAFLCELDESSEKLKDILDK